jgi:hypothetical protein
MDLFSCKYLMYDSEINKFRFKQDMNDIKFMDIMFDYFNLIYTLTNFNVSSKVDGWGSYERFNNEWKYGHRIIKPIKSPDHIKQDYTMMDVNFLYKLYLKAVGKIDEDEDEDKEYREKVTLIDRWLNRGKSSSQNYDYFGDEGVLAMNLNEKSIIVGLLDDNIKKIIKLSMVDKLNNTTPNKTPLLKLLAFCTGLIDDDSTLSDIDIDIIPIIANFLYGGAGEAVRVPSTGGGKNKRRKTKRKSKRKKSKRRKTKRRKSKRR